MAKESVTVRSKKVREGLLKELTPFAPPDYHKALSSGNTLINLAVSGLPHVAFLPGSYNLFVGDSRAGKTWLLLQTMAEACINPVFDNHRIILDQPERGANMEIRKHFGKLAERLETVRSTTLEEFYDRIDSLAKTGDPFILGLDSEDALDAEAELKKRAQNRRARAKAGDGDAEVKGSYGVDKARTNSNRLRTAYNALAENDSMLFIVKQTRQNIGPDAFFNPKTRSGGQSLTFYAAIEIWFSIKSKIKKRTKLGEVAKNRVIGSLLRVQVKKNRSSGREWPVEVPFYVSKDFSGFDEVGGNIRFLIEEGHWPASKLSTGEVKTVEAGEFHFTGSPEALIKKIQEEGGESTLSKLVMEIWESIEDSCRVVRKSRYA